MFENMIPNMKEYRDKAKRILKDPIPEYLIKQREGGGGVMLDYVEGSTVIRKLNAAFDNLWDWDIIKFEITPSVDKKITKKWNNSTRKMETLPNPIFEEQPPVCHVLGRLTVPGFGSRTGFGSKIIIGGASEQEHCLKAASTDALKKAATLFGIALELYEDEPVDFDIYDEEEPVVEENNEHEIPARGGINIPTNTAPKEDTVPTEENDTAKNSSGQEILIIQKYSKELGISGSAALGEYIHEATSGLKTSWSEVSEEELPVIREYLEKLDNDLKTQMTKLGLTDIEGLNPYIRDFSEGEINAFENLNPTHLKTFIIYLERQ